MLLNWNLENWSMDKTVKTVWDMYEYCKENHLPLLSSFQSQSLNDYMDYYADHQAIMDYRFAKMFKDYRYYDQDIDGTNPIDEVTDNFIDEVIGFFLVNDVKLSLKFRVEDTLIDATNNTYNFMNDVNITETKEGERSAEREYVSGTREDGNEMTSGERTDTSTEQVMAYNSSTFADTAKTTNVKGAQEDSNTFTKGEQTDNETVGTTESHTITTKGSRGNMTANIEKYNKTWANYESFWNYVFKEIAKELLIV